MADNNIIWVSQIFYKYQWGHLLVILILIFIEGRFKFLMVNGLQNEITLACVDVILSFGLRNSKCLCETRKNSLLSLFIIYEAG